MIEPKPAAPASPLRRTGPAVAAAPSVPPAWPRRLLVAIVSPHAGLRRDLRAALAHRRSPACVVYDAPTLAACDRAEARIASYFLVDTRTADACDPGEWTANRKHAMLSPRLWILVGEAPPAGAKPGARDDDHPTDTQDAPPDFAADEALAWVEGLLGVPFRTYPGDPTFAPRLRTRIAMLPADATSERLVSAVTTSPAGVQPQHVGPTLGCPACRPEPPATSIRRGTWEAEALLRLVLRPEQYVHGVGHAVLDPTPGGRAAPDRHPARPEQARDEARAKARERLRVSRRRALYRGCADAGLVPPYDAALAALVVRVSALASAFGLRIEQAARLLGFTPAAGTGRPSRSTWHRILVRVTGVPPAQLARLSWSDIGEAARRALVGPTRVRRDLPTPPPHVLHPRPAAPPSPPIAGAWEGAWERDWEDAGDDPLYDQRRGELADAGRDALADTWCDPLDVLRPVLELGPPTRRHDQGSGLEPWLRRVGSDWRYVADRADAFRTYCDPPAADGAPSAPVRVAPGRAHPGSAYAAVLRAGPCLWCGAPGGDAEAQGARGRRSRSQHE